jgi:glutamate synthase domain-containing protein 2
VDYSHLNIQGYAVGAEGLPEGVEAGPDTALFENVNTETEYGWRKKIKMRVPIFTDALGSAKIAKDNWEHLAIGAALRCLDKAIELNQRDPQVQQLVQEIKAFKGS